MYTHKTIVPWRSSQLETLIERSKTYNLDPLLKQSQFDERILATRNFALINKELIEFTSKSDRIGDSGD